MGLVGKIDLLKSLGKHCEYSTSQPVVVVVVVSHSFAKQDDAPSNHLRASFGIIACFISTLYSQGSPDETGNRCN